MMEINNRTAACSSFVHVSIDDKNSVSLLNAFNERVYAVAFPDENERESLDNILDYLTKKKNGWYDKNNYHVILAQKDDAIVGGMICDYFSSSNCGVVEFIVVTTDCQLKGIGTELYKHAVERLQSDAKRA